MMDFSVQIALDFVECTKAQKEVFTKQLELMNWQAINPNKLWVVESAAYKNHTKKNIFKCLFLLTCSIPYRSS